MGAVPHGSLRAVLRAVRARLPRALRRPDGLVDRTRWLFLLLCVVSMLLTLPPSLQDASGARAALGTAASAALLLCWTTTYRRGGRQPWPLDVVEALAFGAFMLASSPPAMVFGVVFATVWYRAVSGTALRSALQCAGWIAALAAAVALWDLARPGEHVEVASVVGVFPVVGTTLLIARTMAASMFARERSARRDAVLARLGTELLGLTDPAQILQRGGAAVRALCEPTPELRAVAVVDDGGADLRVVGTAGPVGELPGRMTAALVPAGAIPGALLPTPIAALLDAAAGRPCAWVCLALPEGSRTWMLLGAPAGVPEEVAVAFRSFANQVALALANSAVHGQLRSQARTDGLTGLANRAAFHEELSAAIAARAGSLAVLYLDLDDFKQVNDRLGHAAGDEVLREVGRRLRAVVRPGDVCARLGGDEYAVLLRDIAPAALEAVGRRLVERVGEAVSTAAGTARVGASVGLVHVEAGAPRQEVLHRADSAMYAAKAAGKNRLHLLTGDQRAVASPGWGTSG